MKKSVSVLFTTVLAVILAFISSFSGPQYGESVLAAGSDTDISVGEQIPGDVNGDNQVDLLDVTTLSRYVAGWTGLTVQQSGLDPTADGTTDLQDVTLLGRFLAGWNVTLNPKITSVYGGRPLVGAVNYEGLKFYSRYYDELSLTPPKWNDRLPFYASVTNDTSRLTRTSSTVQEFVYKTTYSLTHCYIYAALDSHYPVDPMNDIKIYISPDGINYTLWTYSSSEARAVVGADNWQKVNYRAANFPYGNRYLKIVLGKQDSTASGLQLMRADVYCNNAKGNDLIQFTDDFNDYSKMYSHTSGLTFASDNPQNFALVTADDHSEEVMNQQIAYANSAHLDYFAFVDGAKYNLPAVPDLFRSNPNKGNLKYCIIINVKDGETWERRTDRYVSYFKEDAYQKVMGGRPLLYLFMPPDWSKAEMDLLRQKSIAAGCGNPYIVGNATGNYSAFCDAGGSYSGKDAGTVTKYAGTSHTIPLISFGMNDQPRQDNPVPWGNVNLSAPSLTEMQVTGCVNDGIKWCKDNPVANEAGTALIYAWSEHAEAAENIEPTRNPDGTPNTRNLDATGNAIKSWETK